MDAVSQRYCWTTESISTINLHGLKKAICYQNIYGTLCERAGFENKKVPYIDYGDYGWEGEAKKQDCENEEQVKRYFLRMGIHLFLAYALSASDLHGENFLACGEYPVLLDFETLPGYAGWQMVRQLTNRYRIISIRLW